MGSSYTPRDLVNDSCINAPYILTKLKQVQGLVQGMSYWTYTDLFEEPGFHGGFGLVNREGIRKPAWFAYKYLNALKGRNVPLRDAHAFAAVDGQRIAALVWDWQQAVSNTQFYAKQVPNTDSPVLVFRLAHVPAGNYRLQVRKTGYRRNDPLSLYIDMGMPKDLAPRQLAQLQQATRDTPEQDRRVRVGADGVVEIRVPMRSNDVVLMTLEPSAR
ncbi:beta-xylosidase [Xanthomonas arboricola]|nr:beta-xylosidase [Xanthomonas sp. CFBP 8152]